MLANCFPSKPQAGNMLEIHPNAYFLTGGMADSGQKLIQLGGLPLAIIHGSICVMTAFSISNSI